MRYTQLIQLKGFTGESVNFRRSPSEQPRIVQFAQINNSCSTYSPRGFIYDVHSQKPILHIAFENQGVSVEPYQRWVNAKDTLYLLHSESYFFDEPPFSIRVVCGCSSDRTASSDLVFTALSLLLKFVVPYENDDVAVDEACLSKVVIKVW